MDLSDRLQAVANMVTPGNIVADVGCDHAYISIYLIKNKVSDKVIAMDVNEGPLNIARRNISREGYEDKIETRLSDGIEKLLESEADTIIIAGMGGGLTCKILKDSSDKLHRIEELILQPQSEIDLVRKLLKKLNFVIVKEKMLIDDGKYYVVIKAVNYSEENSEANSKSDKFAESCESLDETMDETYYLYGRYLLEKQDPTLHKFLIQQEKVVSNIKDKLEHTQSANAKVRLKKVNKELEYVKTALRYY